MDTQVANVESVNDGKTAVTLTEAGKLHRNEAVLSGTLLKGPQQSLMVANPHPG
jgi:hypothetical protein